MLKRVNYKERGNIEEGLLTEFGSLYNAKTGIMIDRDTVEILSVIKWVDMSTSMDGICDEEVYNHCMDYKSANIPEDIEIKYFILTDEYILFSHELDGYVTDPEGNVLSFKTPDDAIKYLRKEELGND